jgi:hypothetical protein
LAKSSKILLKEKGLGLLGSTVAIDEAAAGVEDVPVALVEAPKVKGALVTELPGFLPSLSPPIVPKEKSEEEGAVAEVAAVEVAADVPVAVVLAGVPKLKLGVVEPVEAMEVEVVLGDPNEKEGVPDAIEAAGLSSVGLLVVVDVPKLNEGVVEVVAGVEVADVKVVGVLAGVAAGFPKEKPPAGVVVDDEGADPSAKGLVEAVVVAVGVEGLSAVLVPNPNVGVADVGAVVGGNFPKVAVPVEAHEVGVPKLNPPVELPAEGAAVLGVLAVLPVDVVAGDPKVGIVEVAGAGALKDD